MILMILLSEDIFNSVLAIFNALTQLYILIVFTPNSSLYLYVRTTVDYSNN